MSQEFNHMGEKKGVRKKAGLHGREAVLKKGEEREKERETLSYREKGKWGREFSKAGKASGRT